MNTELPKERNGNNELGYNQKIPIYTSIPVPTTQPLKPLLTPGQNTLLKLPNIQALISRFDLHSFSSPEARINLLAHHRIQTIIASTVGQLPPPPPDFSIYAPLSEDGHKNYKAFLRKAKEDKLPPGYSLDKNEKPIFDRDFKKKGITEKDLPPDHPDYVPF